jgi:hypothetical protein
LSPVRFWQKITRCLRKGEVSSPAEMSPASGAPLVEPSRNAALDEVLQSAVERLLEDEALTADLVDPAARYLLDWGIARATAIVREAGASPAEAQARLAALRQQMRALARRVGELLPDEQVAALQKLLTEEGQ